MVRKLAPTRRPAKKLADNLSRELRTLYESFDVNSNGKLNQTQFLTLLENLGFYLEPSQLADFLATDPMFKNLYIDRDGITLDQFLSLMLTHLDSLKLQLQHIKAFALFDLECTGKITFNCLKQMVMELGDSLNDKQLELMIQEADRQARGYIDIKEFLNVLRELPNPPPKITNTKMKQYQQSK